MTSSTPKALSEKTAPAKRLTLEPLSKKNWQKFEDLFGTKGACGNCWCMSFRLNKQDFEKGKVRNGNKRKMKNLVWKSRPSGLLGMYGEETIAWCAFAPRQDFIRLEYSRVHRPIDNQDVWSIPCFFVKKEFRRRGVSVAMLKLIIQYAREKKIKIIEAYPLIPTQEKLPDAFVWVGLYKSFERAGFQIVDTTSKHRPMVRYFIGS